MQAVENGVDVDARPADADVVPVRRICGQRKRDAGFQTVGLAHGRRRHRFCHLLAKRQRSAVEPTFGIGVTAVLLAAQIGANVLNHSVDDAIIGRRIILGPLRTIHLETQIREAAVPSQKDGGSIGYQAVVRICLVFRAVVHINIEPAVVALGKKLDVIDQALLRAGNVARQRLAVLEQLNILLVKLPERHSGGLQLAARNAINARARNRHSVIVLISVHPTVCKLLGVSR